MSRTIENIPVCVVGGAGFLGSHLVDYLIEERSCTVVVVDNLVVGRREFINNKAIFEHADICKSEAHLYRIFKEHKIHYVFNYAADPYIPLSFKRPSHVFNTNAVGAINVINAAYDCGVLGTLQVSSAEIYGNNFEDVSPEFRCNGSKIHENFPVTPHSTYGVAKAAIDFYVQCAYKERLQRCIALRQFNCIGERETHPYVVPEIISQLSKQQEWIDNGMIGATTTEILGKRKFENGRVLNLKSPDLATLYLGNNSVRDFQYAGDAVRNAVLLLEKGSWGEVYNMGSEESIKIYEIAQLIGELMDFKLVEVKVDETRKRPWEIWHLQSDNTKLYNVIGKQPVTPLREALKMTIDNYYNIGSKWVWEYELGGR